MDEEARIAIAVLEENAKNTDANFARLEGKVDEIKADMKAGFQRLDGKIDTGLAKLDAKIDTESDKTAAGFATESAKTAAGFARLDGRIDKLDTKIDAVKDSVASAKIWALVLYIALAAGLLGSMAKGFLWLADRIDFAATQSPSVTPGHGQQLPP